MQATKFYHAKQSLLSFLDKDIVITTDFETAKKDAGREGVVYEAFLRTPIDRFFDFNDIRHRELIKKHIPETNYERLEQNPNDQLDLLFNQKYDDADDLLKNLNFKGIVLGNKIWVFEKEYVRVGSVLWNAPVAKYVGSRTTPKIPKFNESLEINNFETDSNVIIIPAGKELFHGTSEEFEAKKLGVGGYDKILWTTHQPAISQTYIPVGSKIYTTTEQIRRPSKDSQIVGLQLALGIVYDYSSVEWDYSGRAKSYYTPKLYGEIAGDKQYHDAEIAINTYINNKLINDYGYEPEDRGYMNNYSWKLMFDKNQIQSHDFRRKGRLFVLTPKTELRILDLRKSGESDLTDLEYHNLGGFRHAERDGYDGVLINDFAQSNDYGNIGHISIGIFKKSIKKLKQEVIPDAVHHDLENHFRNDDWRTPEYKKHRGLDETIRTVIQQEVKKVKPRRNLDEEVLEEAKDNRPVLTKRMNIPPDIADWIHKKNNRYSLWIASNLLKSYNNNVEELVKDFPRIKNELSEKLTSIFDWVSVAGQRIQINLKDLDIEGAYKESVDWHDALQSDSVIKQEKGNILIRYPDGYYWTDLNTRNCPDEAAAMGHCGKTSAGDTILSLRSTHKGILEPHITIAYDRKRKTIFQIKSKKNSKPSPVYHKYIVDLLIKQDIKRFGSEYRSEIDFKINELEPQLLQKLIDNALEKIEKGEAVPPYIFSYLPKEVKNKLAKGSNVYGFVNYVVNLDRGFYQVFERSPSVIGTKDFSVENRYSEKTIKFNMNDIDVYEDSLHAISQAINGVNSDSFYDEQGEEMNYIHNFMNADQQKKMQYIFDFYDFERDVDEEGSINSFIKEFDLEDVLFDEFSRKVANAKVTSYDNSVAGFKGTTPIKDIDYNEVIIDFKKLLETIEDENLFDSPTILDAVRRHIENADVPEYYYAEADIDEMNGYMEKELNDFIEKMEDEDNEEHYKIHTMKALGKLGFKDRRFENEKVSIRVNRYPEAGVVNVTIYYKQKDKHQTGNVRLENLINYMQQFELFESLIRKTFK